MLDKQTQLVRLVATSTESTHWSFFQHSSGTCVQLIEESSSAVTDPAQQKEEDLLYGDF